MCLLCSVCNSFLGCEVCLYNQTLKQMLLISIDLSSFCWWAFVTIFPLWLYLRLPWLHSKPQRQAEKSWTMKCEGIRLRLVAVAVCLENKGGGNGLLSDSSFNKNCLLGGYRAVLGKLSCHFGLADIFFFIKETSSALQMSGKTF